MRTLDEGVTPTALRALSCLNDLALEKGLDDVSMRDVAKRLGISLASLQYHYPNKAALLEAFIRKTVRSYQERIDAALADCQQSERFSRLISFAAEETLRLDRRHDVLAMIEARAGHDDDAKSVLDLFLHSYLEIMRDAVVGHAPQLGPKKAMLAATLVVSILEGLPALVEPSSKLGVSRRRLIEAAVSVAAALPDAIDQGKFRRRQP